MLKITYLVTVYNEIRTVKKAIEDVANINYPNKEIIIIDNGSTDGTQDLIRGYFKEQGIPGVLDETPWRDFAFNRTAAFNAAFNKTDYAFVWDADDEIYGNFKLPENLTADSYLFTYGNAGGTRYSRCQLFNNRLHWKYVGVLHEYPANADGVAKTQETVTGDY
jgi:glycosyltransferase involved in cell wall biosynthesis